MNNEKAGVRFCIQFSRTDPAHLHVAKILKSKARGDKAKYIVNAVLYYESHCGTSEIRHMTLIDEKHLEAAINQILHERDSTYVLPVSPTLNQVHKQRKPVEDTNHDELDVLGADGLNDIANTMETFRKMK